MKYIAAEKLICVLDAVVASAIKAADPSVDILDRGDEINTAVAGISKAFSLLTSIIIR